MRLITDKNMNTFKDTPPLLGQDPHITKYQDNLLLIESQDEERIVLSYLGENNQRVGTKLIWSRVGHHQVWAPELHQIDGFWYVYFTSSDGNNCNHQTMVLGAGLNPFGPYHFVQTIGPDIWGIDMTVFRWNGKRYAVWSGWRNHGEEFPQCLYIAPMISPVEIGDRVMLSSPVFDWELSIAAVNEGPQAFTDNGKLYLLYAANASWTTEYSTGLLELVGEDPLDPSNWIKCPWPLKINAGHGMILDGSFYYHSKMSSMPGWQDREIKMMPTERFLEGGKFEDFKMEEKK